MLPGIGLANCLLKTIMSDFNKNKENDQKKLLNTKIYNDQYLYVFPEGKVFDKNYKKQSDLYCEKNNIIKTNYVLFPKSYGLEIVCNNNKNINDFFCFNYSL